MLSFVLWSESLRDEDFVKRWKWSSLTGSMVVCQKTLMQPEHPERWFFRFLLLLQESRRGCLSLRESIQKSWRWSFFYLSIQRL